MKLTKQSSSSSISNSTNSYLIGVDNDLINIFNAFKGRLRFGAVTNAYRGENLEGEFRIFTSASSAGANIINHTLSAKPTGFILINKGGYGDIYMSSANTTTATFVTSGTSTSYSVFLLK